MTRVNCIIPQILSLISFKKNIWCLYLCFKNGSIHFVNTTVYTRTVDALKSQCTVGSTLSRINPYQKFRRQNIIKFGKVYTPLFGQLCSTENDGDLKFSVSGSSFITPE